jgi:single-stranded-DNA-specific exonuclease
VVVQVGEEESHGSCRSIPEFHITRALEMCDDLLERYGGHAAAAGFTVANTNIELLRKRLTEIAEDSLHLDYLVPTLTVDVDLPLEEANMSLIDALARLEPVGEANTQPIFRTNGVQVIECKRVGREGSHLKMRLSDGNGAWSDAIAFRQGKRADNLPEVIDVVYHLELNEWRGSRRLQLNIQDIKPAQ